MTWVVLGAFVPSTSAAGCPDVEAVFARGTTEAPGVGGIGQAFIDALESKVGPKPMPADVANHVAAVTLFGTPSNRFMDTVAAPPVVFGPLYQPKTLELCAADDPVCSDGGDWAAHAAYADDGMVDQAASFAMSHL